MEDVVVFCQFQVASVNNVRTHVALYTSIVNVNIKIDTELSANYAAEKNHNFEETR